MGKRHMLEIRHGKELVYYTKIFEDGFNPGQDFYNNLNIDCSLAKGKKCETEVNFTKLLQEWWKVVVQTINSADFAKYVEERLMVRDTRSSQIESLYDTMLCDYFYEYNALMNYTALLNPNKLDLQYKAYVVIC